ncbi:hypothetical protein N7532_002142 [Penicillium argentinense]|uniref:Zn(2)-C6 fungal-type domain-containing protein n=1 Tax=Penicillium argentinense TaxID=1131581 RepID=A0A9W9G5D3_9EURO|nr:uncharacterized protein N7532_002142 [Penicillium argentinense]KAJ5111607.1 hypothetical protein N7532_002142 [Penicillium argentinense]
MTSHSARTGDDVSSPRPRKRAKYTQIACNECKRRKLKCSGSKPCARCDRDQIPCLYTSQRPAAPVPAQEIAAKSDRSSHARFQAVDRELDALRDEMRTLSARLKEVEAVNPAISSKDSSQKAPVRLQRILDRPKSPIYIGPTSAEFGLSQRDNDMHDGREADADDDYDATDDHDEYEEENDREKGSIVASPATRSPNLSADAEPSTGGNPLGDLGLEEILRLVQVYEDTVGIMYPCVDLASVRTYVVEYSHSQRSMHPTLPALSAETSDQDWFHARDIQVLKILLAIALLAESHGRSERAAQLADSVEDRFASRLKILEVDMKECLILTLLAIFHSYRDDEVIAWRLTGMAVRGSMELGLHRQETWQKTGGVFPGALEWMWASRLFWCIYVLDRKWSFGTGLPFAIQDSDMDTNLPEPGHSSPYLTCMISYARLSTKIWGLVVGWSNRSREATSDSCAFLDAQVQQWVHSIPRELRFDPNWRSPSGSEHTDRAMMLQVLLALQANQLRILVYRQNLLSGERIAGDMAGASTAVETAKSTIHMLDYFSRVSNVYFERPEPFNYFLISALAALFLAVLHAPARFSQTCRPEFSGRRYATRARTSRRLRKIIRSLKRIQLHVPWQTREAGQGPASRRRASKTGSRSRSHLTPRGTSRPSQIEWDWTPLSWHVESPAARFPTFYQEPGIPTPQNSSTSLWPISPGTAAEAESNECEDLSSFFEVAGGLYFDPRPGADIAGGVETVLSHSGESRNPNPLSAFQVEDEALTRVMAGLL